MAKQTINLGTTPTGAGGDTPRSAFTKTQSNFDELYAAAANAYSRSNVLGAVAVSGGIPTGAIIERGSNANGNYTKFADGTQICTYKSMTIKAIGTPTGALYCSTGEGARGFPLVFASPPSISITACLEEGEGFFLGASTILNSTTQWPNGFVMSQVPRRNQYVFVDYVAIGRWY